MIFPNRKSIRRYASGRAIGSGAYVVHSNRVTGGAIFGPRAGKAKRTFPTRNRVRYTFAAKAIGKPKRFFWQACVTYEGACEGEFGWRDKAPDKPHKYVTASRKSKRHKARGSASKGGYKLLEISDRNGVKWNRRGQVVGSYFFDAKNGQELSEAFEQIADMILLQAAGPQRFGGGGFASGSHSVEVDRAGTVYVLGGSSQKYDFLGTPAFRKWKPKGGFVGTPAAVGRRGEIYTDDFDYGIDVVSARTGRPLRKLISWADPWDRGYGMSASWLETDAAGSIYAGGTVEYYDEEGSELRERAEQRVVKLSRRGEALATWLIDDAPLDRAWSGFTVGPDGNFYLTLRTFEGPRVRKLSPGGAVLAEWPAQAGRFSAGGSSIAVDRRQRVYVVAEDDRRVLKFTSGGRFLEALKVPRNDEIGSFPQEVDVDRFGNVYVLGDLLYKYVPRKRARRLRRCQKRPTNTRKQRKRSGRCVRRAMRR